MRLPRFVRITEPVTETDLMMETRPPFVLARAICIPKKSEERVEEMLADMANGRRTAVKVPGYTVFIVPAGTLSRGVLSDDELEPLLRDMAEFWVEAVAVRKKHKIRLYQEGVPDDVDEINGRKIREAKAEGRKIFLDHK